MILASPSDLIFQWYSHPQAHIPMNAKIDEELGKFTTEKAAVVAAVNAIGAR